MTLGSPQGVTDICGSTDSDLISRQLMLAGARLTAILATEGLTAPTTDVIMSNAVDLLAASQIASKPGAVDPTTNYEVDGFSRKGKLTSQAEDYANQAAEIIKDYIAINTSTTPIPTMAIVGRKGRRIGTYEEMTMAEEDAY